MVAIYRKPAAPAIHGDYLSDKLSGLKVKADSYLDLDAQRELEVHREAMLRSPYGEPVACWVVYIWDDGMDYDLDGTAYRDDAPGDWPHSYHATEKGAQQEAAYLEHYGCNPRNITVAWGWTEPYLEKPILP
jgi:hypothetical protein